MEVDAGELAELKVRPGRAKRRGCPGPLWVQCTVFVKGPFNDTRAYDHPVACLRNRTCPRFLLRGVARESTPQHARAERMLMAGLPLPTVHEHN